MRDWTFTRAYVLDDEATIELRLLQDWQKANNTGEFLTESETTAFTTYRESTEGQTAYQYLIDNHATLGLGDYTD